MLPKNYSQNKNKNKSGSNDTIGIILIIAFSFLLFCVLTGSLILGDIGLAVKNVIMGLIGYFSYPLFLFLIIYGVFLLQNKSLTMKLRNVIALWAIFICAILIIQIATTSIYITDFDNYVSKVFHNYTIGGICFGLLAYALAAALTTVGAYIVLSCCILALFLFVAGFFGGNTSSYVKKRKVKAKDLVPGNAGKTYSGDGGDLFIENILPNSFNSESGDFDSLPDYDSQIMAMYKQQDERFDELRKKYRGNDSDNIVESARREYGFNTASRENTSSERSSSRNNYSDTNKALDDFIVMPPPKNFSQRYVDGDIINGDRTQSKQPPQPQFRFDFEQLKRDAMEEAYDTFGVVPKEEVKPSPKPSSGLEFVEFPEPVHIESVMPVQERKPIINGDDFNVEAEDDQVVDFDAPEEEHPVDTRRPIIVASSITADEPFVKTDEAEAPKEERPQNPIIRASSYDEDIAQEKAEVKKSDDYRREAKQVQSDYQQVDHEKEAPLQRQNEVDIPETLTDNKVFDNIDRDDAVSYLSMSIKPDGGGLIDDFSDSEQVAAENAVISSLIENKAPLFDEKDLVDDDLSAEEYRDIYGHPKFVDVDNSDAQELSDNFEKNTKSFKIVDEVYDASENAKFSSDSQGVKPGVSVADISFEDANKVQFEKVSEERALKPKEPYYYMAPDIGLLTTESDIPEIDPQAYEEKQTALERTLADLGIAANVIGITVGPTITRYELNMPAGMSVRRIENCEQDICYGLACPGKIRIEAPIPGKRAVGIEVPNDKNALVALKDIINSKEFASSSSPLTVALGKDISGNVMITRIDKMPHLLIAGTTGSGKSACLNSLLISLLYKSSPEDVKIVLIDPKRVEFTAYSGLPHMMIKDAITEVPQAINAFKWARDEMERRYKVFQENRVKEILAYNALKDVQSRKLDKMPYLLIIVDEYADLMIGSTDKRKELESLISSIAGKARAAGIHLILATQRPSADVITGTIKSNLPCRIAFAVSNQTNSRIILDKVGAESLLGKGDMLYAPQEKPDGIRIQGAFITTEEVNNIVDQIKINNVSEFDSEFEKALVAQKEEVEVESDASDDAAAGGGYDDYLKDVVRMIIKTGKASGAQIQRRFSVGYMRAMKLIDQMEKLNFIGPDNGSKPREVYITRERFKEFFGEDCDED